MSRVAEVRIAATFSQKEADRLDNTSMHRGVPRTELIRKAVELYLLITDDETPTREAARAARLARLKR